MFTEPAAPAARAKANFSVPLAPAPNPPMVNAQMNEPDLEDTVTPFLASTSTPEMPARTLLSPIFTATAAPKAIPTPQSLPLALLIPSAPALLMIRELSSAITRTVSFRLSTARPETTRSASAINASTSTSMTLIEKDPAPARAKLPLFVLAPAPEMPLARETIVSLETAFTSMLSSATNVESDA